MQKQYVRPTTETDELGIAYICSTSPLEGGIGEDGDVGEIKGWDFTDDEDWFW